MNDRDQVQPAGPAITRRGFCAATALAGAATLASAKALAAQGDAPAELKVLSPLPRQVIQRTGFDPAQAHEHAPLGPVLGHANLQVTLAGAFGDGAKAQARLVPLDGAFGAGLEWTDLDGAFNGGRLEATLQAPAGGWQRLEVRVPGEADKTLAAGAVEPLGIGEVFVIAGQSYAAGANDELLTVEDPHGRVAAFDVQKNVWQTANDPQPRVGDGGTIWPAFANLLLPVLRVPIGLVNVAVGGTATRQWLPGESLYERLQLAGRTLGRFRCVLWQQGESDVIEHIPTATYVERLKNIRASLAAAWGFEPPWLPAKSTLHPTVYNAPVDEGRIRQAIDELWRSPGFLPGPDTDILGGENRGGPQTRRHFSGIGQRRAGLLWFAAVWNALHKEPTS